MALPNKTVVGEHLKSKWLNSLRTEVKKNTIVGTTGMRFNRSVAGTTLANDKSLASFPFTGEVINVVNAEIGYDLQKYWFCGIEAVTNREEMQRNLSTGVDYVARQPQHQDLFGRIAMLAEPIPYLGVGRAFITTSSVMTRVLFNKDGSEDSMRFATIKNLDADPDDEEGYILQACDAIGPIQIIDVEDDTTKHPDEPDWRWAIVRMNDCTTVPKFAEVTEVLTGDDAGKLKVRLATSDGTMIGTAEEPQELLVYDGGI